jgi:hypothetical protein
VDYLSEHTISRPLHNIERRKRWLEEERAAIDNDFRIMLECDREHVTL